MTTITIDALGRYFETLYCLNQNLIVLCGTDIFIHSGEQERRMDEIIIAIPRLIPYGFNKKSGMYEIKKTDGLMNFAEDITFLSEGYESVFSKHKDFLEKVIKIRNKLEHEMHGARITSSYSGTSLFSITYDVAKTEICIFAEELIEFTKDLNILFSRIQEQAKQFIVKHEYTTHPYCCRLIRFNCFDFNKIYESNLLQTFGKALLPF